MLSNYLTLGRSGLRVSPFCLGAMTFGEGGGWTCDEATARGLINAFLDKGGNFIDTADVYTGGESERIVGRALSELGVREQTVVATKYTFDSGAKGVNAFGNGRKNAMRAVDDSLRRLGMDYIDLYWMHAWDTVTPAEEVAETFDALIRSGKIRYYGLSDVPAWYATRVHAVAERYGYARPIALQLEYSLIERAIEREHLPAALELGLGLCPWSPLAGGALSGKYRRNSNPADGRLDDAAWKGRLGKEANWLIIEEVNAIASELGRTPAEIALNWAVTQYHSTSLIIGATKLDQLQANLAALDFCLPDEARARLDAVSRLDLVTPYDFYLPKRIERTMGKFRGFRVSYPAVRA